MIDNSIIIYYTVHDYNTNNIWLKTQDYIKFNSQKLFDGQDVHGWGILSYILGMLY